MSVMQLIIDLQGWKPTPKMANTKSMKINFNFAKLVQLFLSFPFLVSFFPLK